METIHETKSIVINFQALTKSPSFKAMVLCRFAYPGWGAFFIGYI